MNIIESIAAWFQATVAQVPEVVQPLIVALAGAIPSSRAKAPQHWALSEESIP